MDNLILPMWPPHLTETMRIGVALIVAGLAGEVLARFVRLPRVSAYTLAGLLLGPAVCAWFDVGDLFSFRLFIDLALALLLFELGSRVDLKWFRTNPWIIPASLAEAGLTFMATFSVLILMDFTQGFAETVAAIAIATSPAVVMRMATERRAEGQVAQRMLVFTALNVFYSVVLSKLIVGGMHGVFRNDWVSAVLHPVYLLCGSLIAGALIAYAFRLLRRCIELSDEQAVVILLGMLMVALALLQMFALPTMLAPLLAGVMIKSSDRRPLVWPRYFGTVGGVLVIFMFVLMGAMLTVNDMAAGGLAALAVIAARFVGKGIGIVLFAPYGGLSRRQSIALWMTLMPMSAVAFVLVDDIRMLYPEFGAEIGVVVFSMIAALQLIGPIGVQWALQFCNESNKKEH